MTIVSVVGYAKVILQSHQKKKKNTLIVMHSYDEVIHTHVRVVVAPPLICCRPT